MVNYAVRMARLIQSLINYACPFVLRIIIIRFKNLKYLDNYMRDNRRQLKKFIIYILR